MLRGDEDLFSIMEEMSGAAGIDNNPTTTTTRTTTTTTNTSNGPIIPTTKSTSAHETINKNIQHAKISNIPLTDSYPQIRLTSKFTNPNHEIDPYDIESLAQLNIWNPIRTNIRNHNNDDIYTNNNNNNQSTSSLDYVAPTTPMIEVSRRRCHEKFKKEFITIFEPPGGNPSIRAKSFSAFSKKLDRESKAKSFTSASNHNNNNNNNNRKSHPQLNTLWDALPVHSILERWHFACKLEESIRVMDNIRNEPSSSSISNNYANTTNNNFNQAYYSQSQLPNQDHDFELVRMNHIRRLLVMEKDQGRCMDPILITSSLPKNTSIHAPPPSSLSSLSTTKNKQVITNANGYAISNRKTKTTAKLLLNEIDFQIRREWKKAYDTSSSNTTNTTNNTAATTTNKKNQGAINHSNHTLAQLFDSQKYKKKCNYTCRKVSQLATTIEHEFISSLQQISKTLQISCNNRNHGSNKKRNKNIPKISFNHDEFDIHNNNNSIKKNKEEVVSVSYSGLSFRISKVHYIKMQILFDRSNTNSTCETHHYESFASSLFSALARYDMLEGAGLQSSLNGNVFDTLLTHFECQMECFASPFNCRYEHYCSAFPDVDGIFGSVGSFFDYDFCGGEGKGGGRGGCYQANPPFTDDFIVSMYDRMKGLLSMHDQRKGIKTELEKSSSTTTTTTAATPSSQPLMFIVFVPAWKDSEGWKLLNSSPFLSHHLFLSQKNDPHYYCEGTQHRRMTGRYRIASFDTSVFFLQNSLAKVKWPITDEAIQDLKAAFTSIPSDDNHQAKVRTIASNSTRASASKTSMQVASMDHKKKSKENELGLEKNKKQNPRQGKRARSKERLSKSRKKKSKK